jgi:hypothetical protein
MPPRLVPPVGLPTAATVGEEEAWSALVANQLDSVRKSAESWRNGLIAMVGLIGAFTIIKGPAELGGLQSSFGYAVGVLLFMAIICAIAGISMSLEAAYGSPEMITRGAVRAAGGMDGYRLQLATNATSKLGDAQLFALITVVLLAAAVALTWYGPREHSVVLKVERRSQPPVCGTLVSSADGYIDLKGGPGEATRIQTGDIVKMSTVVKCT